MNRPANYATPTDLAEVAIEIASEFDNMRCQVLTEEDAAELKMGAFLGVAQGSDEPAVFVVLEYNPDQTDLDTVVLVGKGITFDTGGISLKPVSYTHLRAHETPEHLVCRLLLEKKKQHHPQLHRHHTS